MMLSVDPGQVHVGLATWRGGGLVEAWECSPEELTGDLAASRLTPNVVVIEAFTLLSPRYNKAAAKQAVDTIKLIGMVHGIGIDNYVVFEQQPSVRHVAQRSPFWTALVAERELPANPHVRSAVAHGLYHYHFGAGRQKQTAA